MLLLQAFAAINLLTFFLFWYDKHCARNGKWRVAEAALLGFCLFGGSFAGFFAMRMFRHKTKKSSFRFRYWLVVTVQAIAILYVFTNPPVLARFRVIAGLNQPAYDAPAQ